MMDPQVREALRQPSSRLHDTLLRYAAARVQAAERKWSERHGRWREVERLYRAFREPDHQDEQVRRQPLTEGVTKIVVPYSYAQVQSMLAFFMAVLTERRPIIPVEGAGPDDVEPAAYMEMVLDWQMERMRTPGVLVLYQWLFDSLRYGIGIVRNVWTIREWPDLVRQFSPILGPMGTPIGYDDQVLEQDVVAYEGNEALNVAPYDFLPDPRRPFAEFQQGEYCAFRIRLSPTELAQREAEGLYAGVAFLDQHRASPSPYTQGSDLARTTDMSEADDLQTTADEHDQPYRELHEVYAWLRPDQLGLPTLSASTTPRLWVLTMVNKARVVRAEPANLPGRRFPAEIIEPNYDVHAPANFGVIETIRGLQYHLSWLYNARMANVRKTLNNEWVVDPSLIEMPDLNDAEAGRLIRLARTAQGAGLIDKAVFPLPVVDVTANHPNDAKLTQELGETVTGANRLIMGMANTGRRAATEVQGQMNLASGRMKMLIELVVTQGLRPWAYQMSRNTQVFLEQTLNLKIAERYAHILDAGMAAQVAPQMLQGEFLFPFAEGGMPNDRLFESNTLQNLLTMGIQTGAAVPLLQQVNWLTLYIRWLRALGIKDVKNFLTAPPPMQVMPDGQVQQQVQQGNLVPGDQGMAMADGFALPPTAASPGAGPQPGNGLYA